MFAVVEDDERLPIGEVVRDRVDQVHPRLTPRADDLGDRLDDSIVIVGRDEVAEVDLAAEVRDRPPADLDRQPRLADAARTEQRDQRVLLEDVSSDTRSTSLTAADE